VTLGASSLHFAVDWHRRLPTGTVEDIPTTSAGSSTSVSQEDGSFSSILGSGRRSATAADGRLA